MAAVPAALSSSAAGFEVRFVDAARGELQRPLSAVVRYPFELAGPVRSFPSFRGQRNNTGWWWAVTTGRHVGFESWLERDHIVRLDFDRAVVGLASQPFWLSWDEGGRKVRHAAGLLRAAG